MALLLLLLAACADENAVTSAGGTTTGATSGDAQIAGGDAADGGATECTPGVVCPPATACVPPLATDPHLLAHWTFDDCTARDLGPGQLNGTLVGGVTCGTGVADKALIFDGKTGYVDVPPGVLNQTQQTFSVGAWVRQDGAGDYAVFLSKESVWEFGFIGGDWSMAAAENEPNKWTWTHVRPLPTATWRHVAMVFDGKTMTWYDNGSPVAIRAFAATLPATLTALRMGCRTLGTDPAPVALFTGALDDVFLFQRALTPGEVASLAHTSVTTEPGWSGGCLPLPACTTATDCNDGNACTDDSCGLEGVCVHGTRTCDDGLACTTDACDLGVGCTITAAVGCGP